MLNIEPATNELLKAFYQKPVPTMKAFVAVKDGRPIGVYGYYIKNETVILFSDMTDELRQEKSFKRLIAKNYKLVLNLLKNTNLPVISIACRDTKGSDVLLKHMGFNPLIGDFYIWQR